MNSESSELKIVVHSSEFSPSRFVFMFGSRFVVLGSRFEGRSLNSEQNGEPRCRILNPELRTSNFEPNLNTN